MSLLHSSTMEDLESEDWVWVLELQGLVWSFVFEYDPRASLCEGHTVGSTEFDLHSRSSGIIFNPRAGGIDSNLLLGKECGFVRWDLLEPSIISITWKNLYS